MNREISVEKGCRPSRYSGRSQRDVVRTSDLASYSRKAYACPECRDEFNTPEILAIHLERHRPVGEAIYSARGKLLSLECPAKCGRYFKTSRDRRVHPDTRHHFSTCDGSEPIERA